MSSRIVVTTLVTTSGLVVTEKRTYSIGTVGKTFTTVGTATVWPITTNTSPASRLTLSAGANRSPVPSSTLPPSSNSSDGSPSTPAKGGSLSTGAKAGIGVAVVVASLLIIGVVLLFWRRKEKTAPLRARNISGAETNIPEKKAEVARDNSAKGRTLPTWKSELSGDSYRAELEANNGQRWVEVGGAKSPTELDTTVVDSGERWKEPEDVVRHNEETQENEVVDLSKPPPIPYASKPKPS